MKPTNHKLRRASCPRARPRPRILASGPGCRNAVDLKSLRPCTYGSREFRHFVDGLAIDHLLTALEVRVLRLPSEWAPRTPAILTPKAFPVQPALLPLHSAPELSLTHFPTNQDPGEPIPTSAQPAPEIELARFGIGQ